MEETSTNIQTTQLPTEEDKPKAAEQPVPPKPDKPKQTFKCLVCGKSWVFIILRFHRDLTLSSCERFLLLLDLLFGLFTFVSFFPSRAQLDLFVSASGIAKKRHYLHIIKLILSTVYIAGKTGDHQLRISTSITWSTSTSGHLFVSFAETPFYATNSLWSMKNLTINRPKNRW
jgi:hypothetical protein